MSNSPSETGSFFSEEDGYLIANKILKNESRPEALFVYADKHSLSGIWKAISEFHLENKLEVVVFTDSPIDIEWLRFQIVYPHKELGRRSVELLNMIVAEKPDVPKRILIDPIKDFCKIKILSE